MLLTFLIYSSIFSLCYAQLILDKSKCDEQTCYIPKSCKTRGNEKDLMHLTNSDNTDANKCDFWFTLNPYSIEKALIRTSSKENLEVNFNDGESFFSCKNENGNVTTGTGQNYKYETISTQKDGDRLYCALLLTRIKFPENKPRTLITRIDVTYVTKMKATYNNVPYTYAQNIMAEDYLKEVRCDPDKILPLPANYEEEGFHYTNPNTEYTVVTCPTKYKLMFVFGPQRNKGKAEKLTSLTCEKKGTNDRYKATFEINSKPPKIIDSQVRFYISCQSDKKLCKMCTDPGVSSGCSPSKECPKYIEATKDDVCDTFECRKFLSTNEFTVRKGAQCTPSITKSGEFEWTVTKYGTNTTQTFSNTECVTEVACQELIPLTVNPQCDPNGCKGLDFDNLPLQCSPGFIIQFVTGTKTFEMDSITCNRSNGTWIGSNNSIIPDGIIINCTLKGSKLPDDDGNSSLHTGGSSEWLLIGCITGGGLLFIIIMLIVLYLVFIRPDKKPAPVVSRCAPPSAPISQPPSTDRTPNLQQPSSGSTTKSQPMTPPVASLPREPMKIVLVVKHEEVKKEKSKMETINIKKFIPDEKSVAANSLTGEKLTEKTGDNSNAETKEQSKTAGTTKEQKTNTQSEVQKKSVTNKGEVNLTKTEEDSKSFIDAYNKELDKKLVKKKYT